MTRIAAIGERELVRGYGLAGAEVLEAATPEAARAALEALGPDVGLLVLSPAAAEAVAGELAERPELIWAALP